MTLEGKFDMIVRETPAQSNAWVFPCYRDTRTPLSCLDIITDKNE